MGYQRQDVVCFRHHACLIVCMHAGMKKGDVLGHEFMGIVEEVGSAVTKFQKGDRAVASFEMGCGKCVFCKHEQYSSCDTTNPRYNSMSSSDGEVSTHIKYVRSNS